MCCVVWDVLNVFFTPLMSDAALLDPVGPIVF